MGDCQFCAIASEDRTAWMLYEDQETVAFLDADPAVEGHTLVAPTAHVEELFASEASASGPVFRTVGTIARAIDRALTPDGFSTFYTSGKLVGAVDHAHVHLLPRTVDDGIRLGLTREALEDTTATRLVDRIRSEL